MEDDRAKNAFFSNAAHIAFSRLLMGKRTSGKTKKLYSL